jgi:hypothetical protein
LLEEIAVGIMGEGDAHRFAGWVMDNTQANIAAMMVHEERRPEWVSVGCAGHCAALSMNDFCTFYKTSVRYSSSWGVEWLDTTNKQAHMAANYLNNSGCAKAIVHQHQLKIYGAKKAIVVSVPTQFGTNQFVMTGLGRSQAALKQAASDTECDKLDSKAKQAGEMFSWYTLWANLSRATAFLQPFNDFIHQNEAGRPALVCMKVSFSWTGMCAVPCSSGRLQNPRQLRGRIAHLGATAGQPAQQRAAAAAAARTCCGLHA